MMKDSAAKVLLTLLLLLSGFLLILSYKSRVALEIKAQTQTPNVACIARDLAIYMNTIIEGAGNLAQIKLLSPAFNLASPYEADIFDLMISQGGEKGNFNSLDGFAGNSYSSVGGQPYTSYQWYAEPIYAGLSWRERFVPHPTFFTEYGDFDYDSGERVAKVNQATSVHATTAADSKVMSINYFNALGGNPEFKRHAVSASEYNQIVSSNPTKAGINSARPVTDNFTQDIRDKGYNAHWVLEISDSKGDVAKVVQYTKNAYARGFKPILRVCYGNSCDFANPADYISFLQDVNSQLSPGEILWVIAGPNEPATELWATPRCIPAEEYSSDFIPCNQTAPDGGEYHSLRPYPASPCHDPSATVKQCGNLFTVQETISVGMDDAIPGSCVGQKPNPITCSFEVDSEVNTQVDMSNAQFPIMGNTQLVPNSVSTTSTIDFKDRMANYASWYLNGVIQRAEERFYSFPSDQDVMLSMSGPLRKLLPFRIQSGDRVGPAIPIPGQTYVASGLRLQQADRAGNDRHNQVAACGPLDSPLACYSQQSDTENRIISIRDVVRVDTLFYSTTFKAPNAFDYIPFSSTEDLIGQSSYSPAGGGGDGVTVTNLGLTFPQVEGQPGMSNPRNLYFAHMQEAKELAQAAQNTFIPGDYRTEHDSQKRDDVQNVSIIEGFCEIQETRSNAGDDLYGDMTRDRSGDGEYQAVLNYTANFECTFEPTINESAYWDCIGQTVVGCYATPEACTAAGGTGWTEPPSPGCVGNLGLCVQQQTGPVPGPGQPGHDPGCFDLAVTYPDTCQKTVDVIMPLNVETPEADSVFDRLVAGSWSVFRRIFPRVSTGSPIENILDIPGVTNVAYLANNIGSEGGDVVSTTSYAGNKNPGNSAEIYFPHIGSVQDYFLEGIQCALRPLGMCGNETFSADEVPAPPPGTPGGEDSILCPYSDSDVNSAMQAAASKYGVPVSMLEAIYQTEGAVYRTNGVCEPNYTGAVGPMQIRAPTYNIVTCEKERVANEFAQCIVSPPLLSRCDVRGAFELAARVLLWNVGQWGYGENICNDLGDIPLSDPVLIRRAGCAYAGYNIFTPGVKCYVPGSPDQIALRNYASGALGNGILACRNGDCNQMDYGDWVCAWVSAHVPGTNYCDSPFNFPDRSGDGT